MYVKPVKAINGAPRVFSAPNCRALADELERRAKDEGRDFKVGSTEPSAPYSYAFSGQAMLITVSPQYILRMPQWPERASRPRAEQTAWRSFYRSVQTHENGHIKIFNDALRSVPTLFKEAAAATIMETAAKLEPLHTNWRAEMNKQQTAYDDATSHGLDQGIVVCP